MSKTTPPGNRSGDRLTLLADAYLHGELSPEDLAELEALIQTDPANAERFIAFTEQASMMREVFTNVADQLEAVEDKETDDFLSILSELDAPEGEDLAPVDFTAELARREKQAKEQSWRARRWAQKQPDFTEQYQPFVISKTAVVLAVAAMLGVVAWLGWPDTKPMDSTDTADRTAQQPDENESRSATSATNVALIRSSVDARWMGLAYDSERRLAQGKTVTLRAGLAEIVFEDGATVIIQGPITFEPTGPNAMRLDTGRIVATVPPAAIGFTIDTPTARIIDYGTEFGVHVDGHASTRVHVFQGEVRAAARVRGVLAEPVRLVEQQAAVIDTGGASIARAAFDAESFERHVVKRLDLVDIIAGGDGTTGRRNRGLDCTTGAVVSRDQLPVTAAQHRLETRGRYLAVPDLEFVDGVFAPRRGWAQVQVSSEGHTFGRFDEATEITFGHLWAGDEVPIPSDYKHDGQLLRMPEAARRGMNEVFGAAGFSGVDDRILLMHAPKGITFDLAAIRLAHEGMQTRRFRSRVVYAGDQMPDYGTGDTTQYPTGADVWVLVDGEVRGVVRDITAEHGPVEIDVELTEDDRYLTLVTTSGSDQVQTFDWLLFGAPEIELAPPPEAD